ncbi:MAG TPA: hypothetical protein VH475_01820 [Tepidisphaeraceae bacterium]|jgi:hypothetical protein
MSSPTALLATLAEAWDASPLPRRDRRLGEAAAPVGPLVGVRYYLGILLGRNLFRLTDREVSDVLVSFVAPFTSERGARLLVADGMQGWSVAALLLRNRVDGHSRGVLRRYATQVRAIEVFLTDPTIGTAALAEAVGTTEKQLARMAYLNQLRAINARLAVEG